MTDVALWSCPDCAFTFDAVHTDVGGGYSCPACAESRLSAALAVLRAQRDATLAECDAAVAEYDKAAAEATTRDADSPAAAARRGLAGGAFLMATAVRAALGVQPEPDNG